MGESDVSGTEAKPDSGGFEVWLDRGPTGLLRCDAVPLAEVPLVIDKIARQLRTTGLRINEAYGVTAARKPGRPASLRRGTIQSLTCSAAAPARVWLAREYLKCDPGCVNCTVQFRLTVYATSPSTCAIESRGAHGYRNTVLKLRTGASVCEQIRQLVNTGAAQTAAEVQRLLQRKLVRADPEPAPHAVDDAFLGAYSKRFQPTYARVKQQVTYNTMKYGTPPPPPCRCPCMARKPRSARLTRALFCGRAGGRHVGSPQTGEAALRELRTLKAQVEDGSWPKVRMRLVAWLPAPHADSLALSRWQSRGARRRYSATRWHSAFRACCSAIRKETRAMPRPSRTISSSACTAWKPCGC
jgi:hypothetical protein